MLATPFPEGKFLTRGSALPLLRHAHQVLAVTSRLILGLTCHPQVTRDDVLSVCSCVYLPRLLRRAFAAIVIVAAANPKNRYRTELRSIWYQDLIRRRYSYFWWICMYESGSSRALQAVINLAGKRTIQQWYEHGLVHRKNLGRLRLLYVHIQPPRPQLCVTSHAKPISLALRPSA